PLVRELYDLARRAVERFDAVDRLADVLAVCADVLDRRRAGESGDARETLDAGEVSLDRHRHERVPRLARRDLRDVIAKLDTTKLHPDHESFEAVVGDQKIAAAAEDE